MKKRNRKIIIVSLLATSMLLTLPTITALKTNKITNDNPSEIEEILKNNGLRKKFPFFLQLFVVLVYQFRVIRSCIWFVLAGVEDGPHHSQTYEHIIPFIRACILVIRADNWMIFWESIAEKMGWEWWPC